MSGERCDVLLVGYEEGENLGLRYLLSYLEKNGVSAIIESYSPSLKAKILFSCISLNPVVVGFSLIFQRFLTDFAELISYLRLNGIRSHFTMGGHFPSVSCREVLNSIPGLDSIVRCEGEITLLELFRNIENRDKWPSIKGLAFRTFSEIVINNPRPLIKELDDLPFPKREKCSFTIQGIGVSTVLGSRGCFYNCSFCSIRQFYSESPGPKRRARSPVNVVKEMKILYNELGTRIFIFEDDDFYADNRLQRRWVEDFLVELKNNDLDQNIVWRISCRINDIKEEILKRMMESGLICVYIGIESGNNTNLVVYNKNYTVPDIYKSVEILEKLGLHFEFGFMLLNPYCNFITLKDDIKFLKWAGRSGLAIAQYTKMVPYAGTPIGKRLISEGRLKGSLELPDYEYEDTRLGLLENFLHMAFSYRNFNPNGLVEKLRYLKFYITVLKKFHPELYKKHFPDIRIEDMIIESNMEFLEKTSMAVELMSDKSETEIIRLWPILDHFISETKSFEKSMSAHLDFFYNNTELEFKN